MVKLRRVTEFLKSDSQRKCPCVFFVKRKPCASLAGKFSRGYGVFTKRVIGMALKIEGLRMARRLQIYKTWGRRAEDPFRGLRAGPVRFSP